MGPVVLTAQEAAAKPRPLEEAVFLARPPTLAAGAPRCIVSGSRLCRACLGARRVHGARAGLPSPFARRYIPPAVGNHHQPVWQGRSGRGRASWPTTSRPSLMRAPAGCDVATCAWPLRRRSASPYPCNALGVSSGCGGAMWWPMVVATSAQLRPEDGRASLPSTKHAYTAQVRTHAGRAGGAD